jgi:hypothetical protein
MVMVSDGPLAPTARGWTPRTTRAVIALATEPIGRSTVESWVATLPSMLVESAKLPRAGMGIDGSVPPTATVAGASMRTLTGGTRAPSLTVTTEAPAISSAASAPIPRTHGHRGRRRTVIRLALACLPVACVRAYLTDDSAPAAASHHAT